MVFIEPMHSNKPNITYLLTSLSIRTKDTSVLNAKDHLKDNLSQTDNHHVWRPTLPDIVINTAMTNFDLQFHLESVKTSYPPSVNTSTDKITVFTNITMGSFATIYSKR